MLLLGTDLETSSAVVRRHQRALLAAPPRWEGQALPPLELSAASVPDPTGYALVILDLSLPDASVVLRARHLLQRTAR